MPYKRIIALLLITFALVACGSSEPSESDIQTAIALTVEALPTDTAVPTTNTPVPTDTAVPATETPLPTETPEPTAVPLSEIDLEPILIQPGDLPGHLEPEQISRHFNDARSEFHVPENYIFQGFYNASYAGGNGGGVSLFLYENPETADATYSLATALPLSNLSSSIHEEIGEKYQGVSAGFNNFERASYTFLRCGAFVNISMTNSTDSDITNYARRLDERLTELLCPATGG